MVDMIKEGHCNRHIEQYIVKLPIETLLQTLADGVCLSELRVAMAIQDQAG